ncbi:MAG: autotransporter outer membrane beta-barrel domain-containing protein [Schwartzia sp.]|nr:autotransporter outer membrane beta-barrel domain-containing protein [Schwartzia sp. (in: firmicutes)]
MKRKNKKLTRLVLVAILAGGAMLAPGVAMATDTVVTDAKVTEDDVEDGLVYGNNIGTLNSIDTGNGAGNTISVQLTSKAVGYVYGADAMTSKISGNTVNMQSGTVNEYIYGGGGEYATSTSTVSGNTVNISGGDIGGSVYGGINNVGGNVTENVVNIYGGTISGNVYGGMAKTSATNNTVNIYAVDDIKGGIYAGQALNTETWEAGTSTGNVVNILGAINISGYLDGDGTQTINIASKGNTVSAIYANPENINFFLPTDTVNGDTMLTVKEDAEVMGTTFGVAAQEGLTSLSKGDSVTLLKAGTLKVDATLKTTTTLTAPTGITTSTEYEFEIAKSGTDSIIATVTGAEEKDESSDEAQELSKSPVETRAVTTTFLNAGADMLASQGFAQAANAVALDMAESAKDSAGAQSVGGFTPFAAFGGQSMRAQSGSYVDTKGFGLNIGFARELPNSQGKLLFGPVVEYGGGNYTSRLEDAADTRGDGKAHYFGVGIMARQVNHNGFYYEGSVRGGRVTSDYESFINNQKVDYDSSSNYFAAHVGVGKAFSVGGGNTLDGYLKYFYSHQAGDDVTIHGSTTGDEDWSFDAVNSHRIRIGARLTHKVNEKNSFYGGLAYQYEFGGEARAHYNGTATPSPSVKGSSGMLELGWQVKPGDGPLTLDLGFTGWAGKQRGGSVQLGATWSF